MSGPFYYAADYGDSKVKFPEYYNEKLFIFEWARNFIKVVSFTDEGDMTKIESFLPGFDFWHPIDVKFGKDGAMYVLQYGSNYFARNPDAQLVRIEYAEGNRQPVAQITTEKSVGAAPLTVKLSALKSYDYDENTKLSYSWEAGNGVTSSEAEPQFTYDKPGVYKPTLTVTDEDGSSATTSIEIKVGNETPNVDIVINGNSSFYFDNTAHSYKVNVTDAEEGTLDDGLDKKQVRFTIDYIKEGKDLALLSSLGSSSVSAKHLKGKSLIDGSDCKSCHSMDKKSIGPTYLEVAERYKGKTNAIPGLVQKIIKGGNGNWGHAMMAAHPQLSEADTRQMVDYILSLAEQRASLPLQGSYKLTEHKGNGEAGSYVILASYTDKGHEITGPLTGREMIVLRHPKVQAEDFDRFFQVGQQRPINNPMVWVSDIKDGSYITFKDIDLEGIKKITVSAQANEGTIEIRKGAVDGELLGTIDAKGTATAWPYPWRELTAEVKNPGGRNELFFVFRNPNNKGRNFMGLDWIEFKR
jgi:cytochrome c